MDHYSVSSSALSVNTPQNFQMDLLKAPDKKSFKDNSKIIFSYFPMKTYVVTPY